jgi:hypothetical protein
VNPLKEKEKLQEINSKAQKESEDENEGEGEEEIEEEEVELKKEIKHEVRQEISSKRRKLTDSERLDRIESILGIKMDAENKKIPKGQENSELKVLHGNVYVSHQTLSVLQLEKSASLLMRKLLNIFFTPAELSKFVRTKKNVKGIKEVADPQLMESLIGTF